ncbi:hypothetical protein GCM10010466_62110 [Planomonospora alba]|uniref:Uncharacterized protein n=1 Tax=Planomonospora alba TaxID=161354 RepID=A0ABP6NZI6_9ACTN
MRSEQGGARRRSARRSDEFSDTPPVLRPGSGPRIQAVVNLHRIIDLRIIGGFSGAEVDVGHVGSLPL